MAKTQTPGVHVETVQRDGIFAGWRGRVYCSERHGWIPSSPGQPASRVCPTWEEAYRWACDRQQAYYRGAGGSIERPRKRMTLREFGEAWLAAGEVSEGTRAQRGSQLRCWLADLGQDVCLDEITTIQIQAAMTALRTAGMVDGTRAQRLRVLRQIMAVAVRDGVIDRDPTANVERPKEKKGARKTPVRTIGHEQVVAIARHLPPGLGLPFALLGYDSGLRMGEAAALRREDLDLDGAYPAVTVAGTVLNSGVVQPHPKSGKARIVPLTTRTVSALREHLAAHPCLPSAFVFHTSRSTHYWTADLRRYWARACQRAEVGYVKYHWMRHSCATHLAESGAPAHLIQKTMGHGSLETTQLYIKDADMADQAAWLDHSAGEGPQPAHGRRRRIG